MNIVVDTNIIFSALLNSEGKIGHLLFNARDIFQFYSVDFLKEEISNHRSKLMKISGFTEEQLIERADLVFKQIRFIDEYLIPSQQFLMAEQLASNVDIDDTPHIALSLHLQAKLWTGDKKLRSGLLFNFHSNKPSHPF